MPEKTAIVKLKHTVGLYAFLLLVWGFYRLLFQLPESLEEFIIKPVIWLGPMVYLLKKEQSSVSSIGITQKNFFPTIYLAIVLGAVFSLEGLIVNYLKYGSVEFYANLGESSFFLLIAVSLSTAVVEELVFRGFIFSRLWSVIKSEWRANFVTALGWVLIHLPIAILDWKFNLGNLVLYAALVFVYSIGASFVFARTKNVFSAILLNFLWQWPIILFR